MTLFKKSILFLLLIQWSFCSAVYAEEPIPIESWKILGPFMIAPRDGGIDPLKKYGGERNIVPSEDQVFHSLYPANGELRWQKLEVDSDQIEVNYDDINWDSPILKTTIKHVTFGHQRRLYTCDPSRILRKLPNNYPQILLSVIL